MLCLCPGFTEEYIDEIKEILVSSNLYLLVLTALITALQVRYYSATKYTSFIQIHLIIVKISDFLCDPD